MLARTIDALLLDVDALVAHDPDGSLRARVARLAAASVAVGLYTRRRADELDGSLDGLRIGPGPVLLAAEAGTRLYDVRADGVHPGAAPAVATRSSDPSVTPVKAATSDPAWQLLLDALIARGIPAQGALVIADDAGFADAARLLDEQLDRRAAKRVPTFEVDPAWAVSDAGPTRRRPAALAALFTLGDGKVATRGVLEEDPGNAAVLATGTYIGTGPTQHLRPGPGWTRLDLAETSPGSSAATPPGSSSGTSSATAAHGGDNPPSTPTRRVLDLRSGALLREELEGDVPLRTIRFASIVRPGVQALRAEGPADRLRPGPALQPPAEGAVETGREDGVAWMHTVGDVGGITAAAVQDVVDSAPRRVVERLAVHRAHPTDVPPVETVIDALGDAAQAGFDALLAEHRRAWAERWRQVDVEIPDDPAAQHAFRFALFQLWTNVGCPVGGDGAWNGEERAVGARGIAGQGYAGHVFWDADVFTLPAMTTICPAAARAMIEYRIRRLPAARARAAADRRAGARFPWESARDGDEVTPTSGLLGTEIMQIRTGDLEEHISADVAWAASRYAAWSGDGDLLTGAARPLVVETARYWASRIIRTPDGRAHVNDVIGPDEYHEGVDDNAFTNIMARWNLRRGAELTDDEAEARQWRGLAEALVDGYDGSTRRHEQFAGYNGLESLVVEGIAQLPFAADLVLGRGRVWRSQLIKQPDVLMAHFMVPRDLPPGSLEADLDFYAPRTSHGSSLSPAIIAALLARAGRPDEALDTLRLALRLDLDDITGSSTGGLHLATIGGTWSALVEGFLGLSVLDGVLHVDPQLPAAWGSVRVRLAALDAHVGVSVTPDTLTVTTDRPLRVRAAGAEAADVAARAEFASTDAGWRLVRNGVDLS